METRVLCPFGGQVLDRHHGQFDLSEPLADNFLSAEKGQRAGIVDEQ